MIEPRFSFLLFACCLLPVAPLVGCGGGVVDGPHCALLDGDATCAALGDSLPFCSAGCMRSPQGNGCVAQRPADDCYSPCGGGLTVDQLSECPAATTTAAGSDTLAPPGTGTDTTTGSGPGPSSGDDTSGACTTDEDCSPQLCVGGACVTCDATPQPDQACARHDPARPLCVDGTCVACTAADAGACGGTTPICDEPSGTCVGCTTHDQCGGSACHIEQGSCMPAERVWWVDGDAPDCAAGLGTPRQPYCTIAEAVQQVGPGQLGTVWLAERDDGLPYADSITVGAGRVLALRAADGDVPRITGEGVGSPLSVAGGAVAYLDGGRIDGSVDAEAIVVLGGVLHLSRYRVVQNSGGGISLSNGASLVADTTVIGANGAALVEAQALRVTDAQFDLRYVTIAGNDSSGVASLVCAGASLGTVRNSIVIGLDPGSIDCEPLVASDSAVDSMIAGEGLVVLDTFDPAWFVAPGAGDFHVAPGHPFADVARWQPGDPAFDLDGEPRPQRPDALDVAGADR